MNRIRLRFSLGSLLLIVVIIAMSLGWWLDHSRLERELINVQTRMAARELLAKEQEKLKAVSGGYGRGFGQGYSGSVEPTKTRFQTVGEFIEALRDTVDWYEFQDEMIPFAQSAVADANVASLVVLFKDPKPEVRKRAVYTVGYIPQQAETTVPAIIQLLQDPDLGVRDHAAMALGQLGTKARSALPALREVLNRELSLVAARSAGSIFQIDPSIDVEPRLQELLRNGDRTTQFFTTQAMWFMVQKKAVSQATVDAVLEAYRAQEDEASKQPYAKLLELIDKGPTPERPASPK